MPIPWVLTDQYTPCVTVAVALGSALGKRLSAQRFHRLCEVPCTNYCMTYFASAKGKICSTDRSQAPGTPSDQWPHVVCHLSSTSVVGMDMLFVFKGETALYLISWGKVPKFNFLRFRSTTKHCYYGMG